MAVKRNVSIIIPNYNGADLLKQYLPYTFAAADHADVDYEVIVVDDASTDDSIAFVEAHYPQVVLVKNATNRGFSLSCNEGMKVAQYDLLLFLNSDVKLSPDYFEHQWTYFEQEDTFGVMGRIMSMDQQRMEDTARYPNFMGYRIKATSFFYSNDKEPSIPTTYLSGANALVDAKKMKAMGGFDPIFSPFYAEDLDLGLRAWRAGWKCFYEHQSVCYHQVSTTTKNHCTKDWVKEIYYRNRFLVHAIHLEGISFWMWYLHVLFLEVLPKLLIGKFWILRSYRQFLSQSKAIARSKKQLSQLMKRNKSSFSLFEVKKIITLEMKGKEIIWL
ncbi:MAG TPA: glycosyltransferase family 2 protein [Cyclobacteriaceae bacterium]|nr:glycosyltransferase family 2 protein [Cyclobacteriaceae bacterium]